MVSLFILLSDTSLMQVESVDSFLQSLGLEKYSITFQAEEVCVLMTLLSYLQ